jgi:hypothetical protein
MHLRAAGCEGDLAASFPGRGDIGKKASTENAVAPAGVQGGAAAANFSIGERWC